MLQYVGARYVPKMFNQNGSNEWVPGIQYESLTVVSYLNNSYTSVQNVPANIGAPNENPEYWTNIGLYGEKFDALANEIATANTTANQANANAQTAINKANAVSEQFAGVQQSVNNLHTEVGNLTAEQETQGQDITTLKNSVSALNTSQSSQDAEITTLSGKVANNATGIANNTKSIQTINGNLETVNTQITAANASIAQNAGKISDVETSVELVEETVAGLSKGFTSLRNINLLVLTDQCGIAQSGSTGFLSLLTIAINSAGGKMTSKSDANAGFTTSVSYLSMLQNIPKKDYNAILICGMANDCVPSNTTTIFNATKTFYDEAQKIYPGVPIYLVNWTKRKNVEYITLPWNVSVDERIIYNRASTLICLSRNYINDTGNPNTTLASLYKDVALEFLQTGNIAKYISIAEGTDALYVIGTEAYVAFNNATVANTGYVEGDFVWLPKNNSASYSTIAILEVNGDNEAGMLNFSKNGVLATTFRIIGPTDVVKVPEQRFPIYPIILT